MTALDDAVALATERRGRCSPHPPAAAILERGGLRAVAVTREDGRHPILQLADRHGLIGGRLTATMGLPPEQEPALGDLAAITLGVPWPGQPGEIDPRCARLVLGWARCRSLGLPVVTSKAALSLDGNIATATGESQWITGEAARRDGHALRDQSDAILVGLGTVTADDPRLTCRLPGGSHPRPVVLDSGLRIPATARLLHGPTRAVVVTTEEAPQRILPADILRVACRDGRVDARQALMALGALGLHEVLVEGGAEVHRSLLDQGLVDRLCLYLAPKVIAGGRRWVGGSPLERLADAPSLRIASVDLLGEDLRVSLLPVLSSHDPWGRSVT
ncbi:MAG: diaminohydroxyphosphoribosylaminopyrimidine deaminase [Myxococcota bacterium]